MSLDRRTARRHMSDRPGGSSHVEVRSCFISIPSDASEHLPSAQHRAAGQSTKQSLFPHSAGSHSVTSSSYLPRILPLQTSTGPRIGSGTSDWGNEHEGALYEYCGLCRHQLLSGTRERCESRRRSQSAVGCLPVPSCSGSWGDFQRGRPAAASPPPLLTPTLT